MADFAPNFTARLRVNYSSLGKSHSQIWRVASSVTDPTDIAAKAVLFYSDLAPVRFNDWTIVSASFAPADSDVFLPASIGTPTAGSVSTSGAVLTDPAVSISFVGRSTLGNKARMFLYGTTFRDVVTTSVGADWRVTSAENAAISAAIVRLNETSPSLVANDDAIASWYEYVNVKYNDRWVRRMRRG
jgi:hypothetical protein